MKTLALFLTLFVVPSIAEAAGFEGVIYYKLSETGGSPRRMQYAVKGRKARITTEGKHGGVFLMDSATRTSWILNAEKKIAMKRAVSPDETPAARRKSSKKSEFTNTGKRQVVAGIECEVYNFSDDTTEGMVCNTRGMGAFLFAGGGAPGRGMSVWEREAVNNEFFPLKITSKNINSGSTLMMEAERVEEKRMNDADFEVPADYKVVEGFGGKDGKIGGMTTEDFGKKMMNATPEERKKMAEELRKAYGADK